MDRNTRMRERSEVLRALSQVSRAMGVASMLYVGGCTARAQDKPAPAKTNANEAKGPTPDNHVVREGDTLWDLSGRYMSSNYEWPRLWSYNPEITNPHWIYPGHVLRLREGAEGGYSTTPPEAGGAAAEGAAGQPGAVAGSRFGSGFGTMLAKNARLATNTVVVGEEVYLDREALERAAKIVGAPEEKMMLVEADEVYLQFPKGVEPTEGKELTVYLRQHRREVSPHAGPVRAYPPNGKGEVVRVLGGLRIESFDDKHHIAKAVITEALDPIERGFEVTDVPRKLAQVAPRTNARRVESKILSSTRPLGTLGQNQLVFIGAGSKAGVEVGNRFFVIRQGDPWRQNLTLREDLSGAERPDPSPPKDSKYPWEVVAEIRVLYVRPETCTAIITAAEREVVPGDVVEMREGY